MIVLINCIHAMRMLYNMALYILILYNIIQYVNNICIYYYIQYNVGTAV